MMIFAKRIVYVLDEDEFVNKAISFLLNTMNVECELFRCADEFISSLGRLKNGCLLLDLELPDDGAFRVQRALCERRLAFPVITMAASDDPVGLMAAMQRGVAHHLEMPFDEANLEHALECGFAWLEGGVDANGRHADAARLIASLSATQTLVLRGIIAGMSTAEIASTLHMTPLQAHRIRAHMGERLGLERTSDFLAISHAANLRPLDTTEHGHSHGQ